MPDRHAPLSRRNFLLATASAGLLAACATPVPAEPVETVRGPTMASLLAGQAVPIRHLVPDDPGITALARRLAEAKIVGLGEATHGSHQDALLKSLLVQDMVENHGLRLILFEANRTGTDQLNIYASAMPTGLLAAEAVKQAPIFNVLKTEVMADLLAWLRGWNAVNADQPVRLVGIDCQASSTDAADALAALATVDSGAADAISVALAPILTDAAKAARHDLMLKTISSAQRFEAEAACRMLEAELERLGLDNAAFTARRAWQGLNAFEYETSDGDMSLANLEYWSRRDVFMAQNALSLAGADKAALWGHNIHVQGGRPAGQGAGYIPSGAVLREELGQGYAALIQEFTDATFLAVPPDAAPDAAPITLTRTARPDTLNALLTEASGQLAWFDLATLPDNSMVTGWRETPIGMEWYGAKAHPEPQASEVPRVPPGALFDVLVIHPELTPSRML